MQLLQEFGAWKSSTELSYDSTIPILGTSPEELTAGIQILYTNVHAALFTTGKRWKPPKCPSMDKWVNKAGCLHVKNEIIFGHKQEWSTGTCYNMNEYWKYVTWNKKRKDKYYMMLLVWGTTNRHTHRDRKQNRGDQGLEEWEKIA
jgi:hypothetical protein